MSISLSSSWIANALGLTAKFQRKYSHFSSDSRKVGHGAVFVALPGEKFDGHDFIQSAIQAGAQALLLRSDRVPHDLPADIETFAVPDVVEAYRTLAHHWRKQFSIPTICIAGSVGKTTTKELVTAILSGRYSKVVSTQGSQNGFVGIPMTLLSIPKDAEVAVVEVGIDEPGAMLQHIRLVEPTHSLLTAIGPEHLERLLNIETVVKEESLALSEPAARGATVIVKLDDPWIAKISARLPATALKWTCSLESASASKAPVPDPSTHVVGHAHSERDLLKVDLGDGSSFELQLPLPGAHNASNLLLAVTLARSLGFSPIEIQRGLSNFKGAGARSEVRILPGSTPVVCDYYNANPTSVEAGIDLLDRVAKQNGSNRKFLVLGDMLELGEKEEDFHRSLARKIEAIGIDSILLYGPRMRWLADELAKRKARSTVRHFESHERLAESLLQQFKTGEALLIKGSRGMKMEEVWKKVEPVLIASQTVGGE